MATETVRTRLESLADRHPALVFFAATLAVSWSLWTVPALGGATPTKAVLVPGGFGPAVGALAVVRLRGDGVRSWLADALDPRVALRWYAVALGAPLAMAVGVGGLFYAVTGSFDAARVAELAPAYLPWLLFATLLGGGQEELGWRGLALPALQSRVGALTASVLVGVGWAVWHLPLFVLDAPGYAGKPFGLYVLLAVALAVVFTWLYNSAGGALLPAMLLHGGINTAPNLATMAVGGQSAPVPLYAVYGGVAAVGALAVVLWHGRRTLSAEVAVRSLRGDRRAGS